MLRMINLIANSKHFGIHVNKQVNCFSKTFGFVIHFTDRLTFLQEEEKVKMSEFENWKNFTKKTFFISVRIDEFQIL